MTDPIQPQNSFEASLTLQAINPLITSTIDVFDMMLMARAHRRKLEPISEGTQFYPLNTVIDFSGKLDGRICISMPERTAIVAVARLLDQACDSQINERHLDAISELANIIAGGAKKNLEKFEMSLTPPRIILQQQVRDFPPNSYPMLLRFSSDIGPLLIAFALCPSNVETIA
ncbi:MAG: hypothetical protein Tsb009_27690 [Planctomycetaceae bacterium]